MSADSTIRQKNFCDKEDFDFHASSIVKLLGIKGTINTAQLLIGGELKKLISHKPANSRKV